ncbi:FAD binding domain-containing protein [Colletotrichum navitas]|uniref:FAD binding domain-containing protein n=1 Tax=Colletotrichum navitas TaxID=681940 RepID=A0AAD8PZE3_9PEZI|nr:FAD binding domain-containing protein [Colletotrichum navitas]KAK1589932.1 FAD binding domain-containing protein [Colletotrichum navitas]
MVRSSSWLMAATALLGPASANLAAAAAAASPANPGCAELLQSSPDKTFVPGDDEYERERNAFCRETGARFAVRGGGHMAVEGASSIEDGILIVASSLGALSVSEDLKTADIGPGHTWGEVYARLAEDDLAVAGGRLSPVGVPGLLLGGGVSFYANQGGWSADTVVAYEVVPADGTIANVTAESDPELFWALKGGSSNLDLVTRFTMRTFPSKKVFAGAYTVAGEHVPAFLEAVADFSTANTDPLSHAVPMVVPTDSNNSVASAVLFYDSETESNPGCFKPFFDIPSIANTMCFKTLADFSAEVGGLVVEDINDVFIAGCTVGKDRETILKGVRISHDVFVNSLDSLFEAVPKGDFVLLSVNWQPITQTWQDASRRSNPGGNALGIDVETKGIYNAWAWAVEWSSSRYDEAVLAWVKETTAEAERQTKEAGIYDAFNYMGDASGFQEIYAGYGEDNKRKLLDVSRTVDPERTFQSLMPGGFKIGA